MVFSRGLVISLGVSALSATLLFLYFRNRINSVERKVGVMFDLIQSHEVDRQQMAQQQMMMSRESAPVSSNAGAWAGEDNQPERDLIDVSDDEEYESDDSREVSDDEEDLEERIKLVTNDIDLVEDKAEDDIVVLESENTETVTVDETVELEEVTDNIQDNGSSNNNETTIQSVSAANESDEVDEADDSLEDSDSDSEEEEEIKPVVEEVQYHKLKVTELKAIAEAKGLTNYKSLKKQPLIDLIKAAE